MTATMPIPTGIPITPLPPRDPRPEWLAPYAECGRVHQGTDHTTRARAGATTDRERGE